ncbi:MAG: QueT transporter family protein [bacterium]
MRELITMWRDTRMVVLTATTAALYSALMIPFKALVIIPGLTEIRPAVSIPIALSFVFGPSAAWGAAIGNLVGDIFGGMLGWGSLFGFVGNFLFAYIPYKIVKPPRWVEPLGKKRVVLIILTSVIASITCGTVIGLGTDILGLAPFAALSNIIAINNTIACAILAPIIIRLILPRVRRWNLLYPQILGEKYYQRKKTFWIGLTLLLVGCLGGYIIGNLLSIGVMHYDPMRMVELSNQNSQVIIGTSLLPAITMIVLSMFFL